MSDTNAIVARAMADLQTAERAIERSREALAAAERDAADLRTFLTRLQHYTGGLPPEDISEQKAPNTEHGENVRIRSVPKEGTIGRQLGDASIEAINQAGRSLPIGELLDALLRAGVPVGGSDQKSNLAGYLSRDPRVVSLGRTLGWTVVKNEEAASSLAGSGAASSITEGGTDDRSTLAFSDFDDL